MRLFLLSLFLVLVASSLARADDLPCISTTFNLLSPNDKVCVSEFDDLAVPGVACFISQARKGGWGQPFGLNEDPSNFSVSCRQIGPITVDLATLPEKDEAFSQKTSIFFKRTRIYRLPDAKRRVIIYVAVSSKIINGSPANSIDVVPVLPWPQTP
jgi:CreA protein